MILNHTRKFSKNINIEHVLSAASYSFLYRVYRLLFLITGYSIKTGL